MAVAWWGASPGRWCAGTAPRCSPGAVALRPRPRGAAGRRGNRPPAAGRHGREGRPRGSDRPHRRRRGRRAGGDRQGRPARAALRHRAARGGRGGARGAAPRRARGGAARDALLATGADVADLIARVEELASDRAGGPRAARRSGAAAPRPTPHPAAAAIAAAGPAGRGYPDRSGGSGGPPAARFNDRWRAAGGEVVKARPSVAPPAHRGRARRARRGRGAAPRSPKARTSRRSSAQEGRRGRLHPTCSAAPRDSSSRRAPRRRPRRRRSGLDSGGGAGREGGARRRPYAIGRGHTGMQDETRKVAGGLGDSRPVGEHGRSHRAAGAGAGQAARHRREDRRSGWPSTSSRAGPSYARELPPRCSEVGARSASAPAA